MKKSSISENVDDPAYSFKVVVKSGEMVSWRTLLKAFVGLLAAQGYHWKEEVAKSFEDLTSEED